MKVVGYILLVVSTLVLGFAALQLLLVGLMMYDTSKISLHSTCDVTKWFGGRTDLCNPRTSERLGILFRTVDPVLLWGVLFVLSIAVLTLVSRRLNSRENW